jgi:TolA-binding protein
MAMESAPPSRNLWQLPVFLLGIAALGAVWYGRPYWHLTASQRYERDVTELKQTLDKVPVDPTQVQALLRKFQSSEPPPHLARQMPYVLGSALVIIAEATASPEEAAELWKSARQKLEEADAAGVADSDRQRLRFRLAKTWANTGEPPAKAIEALASTLNCGDDAGEGNRILARLYLSLEPPDSKKARDCLKEYLALVLPGRGDVQQRQVNQARLSLGELHTQLGEPDEARRVLERIGPDAPPELLIVARTQLAKSYQAEENWSAAIRCLEQAHDVHGISAASRTMVVYHLGEAYLKGGNKDRAVKSFEKLRSGTGPEAQAAMFRLASLLLADAAKRENAITSLEVALAGVKSAELYDNKLVPLKDARLLCEEIAHKCRLAGAFDLAVRAARAYSRIADKGRDRELAAETLQAWGQALLDQAPQAEPEDRPRLVDDGTKRIRESAREWHALAALKKTSAEKGEPLYRAADLFLKAGDQEEALRMLDELGLKVPDFPQDRLAEVWLKKGEVYLSLGNREQARLCFQNGIQVGEQHPSPALLKCRIRLAEVVLKSGDPASLTRAIADLEKALADPEFAKDKELHESALWFIADAFSQQRDYRKAEVRFRTLLDTYPEGQRALSARFQLGQCYWFIAGQEADRCKAARKIIDDPATPEVRKIEMQAAYDASYKQYLEWLKKAAEPFKAVETALLKGMAADPKLSPAEAELLRKASFAAADCAFFLGEYEDCVLRYDMIAQRYAGTVVHLEALRSMWRCYQYYLQNAEKAQNTLTQMRTAYLQLPDSEFDGSSDARRKDYWQKWFEQVSMMKK